MFEFTGLTSDAAPVVNVIADRAPTANPAATGPSCRNTAHAPSSSDAAVISTDTTSIPVAAPNSRTGPAIR
jgi:hypothetical protein